MGERDVTFCQFTFDELSRCFCVDAPSQQLAGWIDRGEFRGTPDGGGSARARAFSVRDGLCATLMAQHLNGVVASGTTSAMIANRAAGEIMRSPAFKILTDPDNAPADEFLLQISRADIWVVRLVRRDELDFGDSYTSLVINVSKLLRNIAERLGCTFGSEGSLPAGR